MKIHANDVSCPSDIRAPLRSLQHFGDLRFAERSDPERRVHTFVIFVDGEGWFAEQDAPIDKILRVDWFLEETAFATFDQTADFDDICVLRIQFSPFLSPEIAEPDALDHEGLFHVDFLFTYGPCNNCQHETYLPCEADAPQ